MKIALVHLNLAVESGDPRMFFSIAQAFLKENHKVVCYTGAFDPLCFPNLHKNLNIKAVSSEKPPQSLKGANSFLTAALDRLQRNRWMHKAVDLISKKLDPDFDVLICQNDYSYQLGVAYKKINPNVRVAWIMNNAPFHHVPKKNALLNIGSLMIAAWEKYRIFRYIRGIDLIVVHDVERKKMAGVFGKRTVVLRIPVDFDWFFNSPKKSNEPRRSVTLLSVGSLSPTRKFEDTIKAVAELRKKDYDAHANIVCKDFWHDAKYRNDLLGLVRSLGLDKLVRFWFDGVTEEELQTIQRTSDVFVFPNHINIWGMAAFEAMAAGLPLVVSNVTSVAEVLKDQENALFVNPGHPDEIAVQIQCIVDDPTLYYRIAEAGQKFVKENLSWNKYVIDFINKACENVQ